MPTTKVRGYAAAMPRPQTHGRRLPPPHECPHRLRRERWSTATQSGRGRPEANFFQRSGIGSETPAASSASRSDSAIRCCLPTLVARRRPERIHRLTVSGLRATRRAASGTVNMGCNYYSFAAARCPAMPPVLPYTPRTSRSASSTARSSAAASLPAEAPSRTGSTTDVCSTSTRVS